MSKVDKIVEGQVEMSDILDEFEQYIELREHAMDYLDTMSSAEIAGVVREGILTLAEVEDVLKRKHLGRLA